VGGPDRRLGIEPLEDRSLPSATVTLATLGDSLTASYAGQPWGAQGDQSWTQQLAAHDSRHLTIDNVAVSGATSSDALAQAKTVAAQAASGAVHYAVLIVGANDVSQYLSSFEQGNPSAFVSEVVANIETALTTLAAAGDLHLAVGDIPDVTITPAFQSQLQGQPALAQEISGAIAAANQQIEAFAFSHGIPVIDMAGLGRLAENPLVIGGVSVSSLYAPGGFHPSTVAQGILGDTVLQALATAYNPSLARFELSDQQILNDAGISHPPGHSFYDVGRYVLAAPRHEGWGDPDDAGLGGRGPGVWRSEAALLHQPFLAASFGPWEYTLSGYWQGIPNY
jgi:lysophospholipase L1-like esterase